MNKKKTNTNKKKTTYNTCGRVLDVTKKICFCRRGNLGTSRRVVVFECTLDGGGIASIVGADGYVCYFATITMRMVVS